MRQTFRAFAPASITVMLVTLLAAPANAGAGALDKSFGARGVVVTNFLGSFGAEGMAIQPDGRIVAVGTSGGNFALARYNPDGSLDTSFDVDGKVTTDFGRDDGALEVLVQPDGKIVAVGFSAAFPDGDFAVARYNPDGSLDSTFDLDGLATIDFGGYEVANTVGLQSQDGKIVVGGFRFNQASSSDDWVLARLNPDGGLDSGFDADGRVVTDFAAPPFERLWQVLIQGDGKIVAVGNVGDENHFALARYRTDGSLDPEYGSAGTVVTGLGLSASARAAAMLPDGRVVVLGTGRGTSGSADFVLARFTGNGSLDPAFGTSGTVTTDFGAFDFGFETTIQADGKIVAVGYTTSDFNDLNFALARYLPDGTPDASFGKNGRVTTDLSLNDVAMDVVSQADGKIVAAGVVSGGNWVLARYRAHLKHPNMV